MNRLILRQTRCSRLPQSQKLHEYAITKTNTQLPTSLLPLSATATPSYLRSYSRYAKGASYPIKSSLPNTSSAYLCLSSSPLYPTSRISSLWHLHISSSHALNHLSLPFLIPHIH
uniref:Putative ovule protein n=1 Tax=Solanum chacoense TaxID=4108 RepID=A0A0V0HAX0_SOLCH